jgi:surface antigen
MHNSKKLIIVAVTSLSILLSACATPGRGENEQAGMIIGSILGGVLGSEVGKGHGRTAAIIAGTLIGSQIGGNVGRSMDDTDRLKAAHSLETVRTGVSSSWRNPDTGNEYTVRPTRTYNASSGPCREYTVDGVIAGKREKIYGTACRQADGSWKTMN